MTLQKFVIEYLPAETLPYFFLLFFCCIWDISVYLQSITEVKGVQA